MQTSVFHPVVDWVRAERSPRIVLVYEDFETASRVRWTLPQLVRELLGEEGEDIIPGTSFWKFDLLQYRRLPSTLILCRSLTVPGPVFDYAGQYILVKPYSFISRLRILRPWVKGSALSR